MSQSISIHLNTDLCTYGRVGLDDLDGRLIERARVTLEAREIEGLVNSSRLNTATGQSLSVDAGYPSSVKVKIVCRLERYDEFARNDTLGGGQSGGDSGQAKQEKLHVPS